MRAGFCIAAGLRAELPPRAERAFVTLVATPADLPGADALIRSLRLSGTGADIAVLHHRLSASGLSRLRALGARLIAADPLPLSDGFAAAHGGGTLPRHADLPCADRPASRSPLDDFSKLRLWQLDYARCVFVAANALVLRPVEKLFDFPEFCAAPDLRAGLDGFHRMNAGVFTARPDPDTFRHMLSRLDRPGRLWPQAEQSFLQNYFPDWHGLPVQYNLMQDVWLNLPDLWSWDAIHILNFQSDVPWQPRDKAARLAPLIAIWRQIAEGGPIPDLARQQRPAA